MASRVSSMSSVSSVSSIERRTAGSHSFMPTPAAAVSAHDVEEPTIVQRATADHVHDTVTEEPLLASGESDHREHLIANHKLNGPVHTPQMHYGTRSWYYDWWFWEAAGALLSLGSTIAIVVMLAVCNNRPMPALRFGITLNAMLSVLSTVAKTSMLLATTESIGQAKWLLFRKQSRNLADFKTIDEASRGPWGAFQLLYRFWDGRTLLASVGAFIVLASLAVDPFVQQVLSYPSVSNVTNGYQQPNFPRVTTSNRSGHLVYWESADEDPTSAVPLALRAAIYNSLLGLGTASSTLNINCPSGNCTFDLSDTLGFCSACSDVTAQVTKVCDEIPKTDSNSGTNCTYTLPGKLNLEAIDEQVPDDFGSAEEFSPDFRRTTNMSVLPLHRYETLWANDPEVVQSFEDPDYTKSKPAKTLFQGVADPILGFGRILFGTSKNPASAIGSNVMPTATECALYWCVQTLNTSIQNGVLNQTVVRTWSNSSANDTSDVHLSPYTSGSYIGGRHTANDYYVSPMSNVPLARFLENAFNATVRGLKMPGIGYTEEELLDLTIYSSDIAQALWHVDDLDSLMNNLADRMTDALRNLYSDPVTDAADLGKVYTTQTYVHVTWPWLILPVALVIASCLVLLAAIISSSRHQTIVWKSSSLAVLFHGLASAGGAGGGSGGEGGIGAGGIAHSMYKKEMEMTAEEMKVRLAETVDGDIRLVQTIKQQQQRGDIGASNNHSRGRWRELVDFGNR